MTAKSPSIDIDLFSDEAIADPYPLYEQVRNVGAVVWLEPYDMWAISRFEDVRAALRAESILLSGKGVAMNDALNNSGNTNTLVSDGDEHRRLRSALMKPMMPRAVRDIRERVQQLSDELVERLLALESFDGMSDFSRYLPVSLISVLIGLPPDGRARMLEWAGAAFNALGPMNERARTGLPGVMEAGRYVRDLDPADLPPQGWAAGLFRAADEGKIDLSEARKLVFDYIIPSLDTTILGAGHLLYQFGRNPDQFDKVKNDRSLIPAAV
ncbi:cytochrome P450, partial [Candidatus Poriferisodalis sp.]|uniref:cytochrome P450 n=1 Tax=Candidatus Poriferisodalis sp. TaxID=3101277 RepID=UPI003B5259DD